ncbi:hypothetical protein GCM10009733_008250 [Nonomuraea maheshkhaliensis]|uniref:Uncharacterized protein n=1 Tax=Nonomuraea maheshkhaliensis TaxID=419590 RepID=A0ABN2EQ91_9ACTN
MTYRDAREIEPHWFVYVEVPDSAESPWREVEMVITTDHHVYLLGAQGLLLGVAALGDRVRSITPVEWESLQR